MANIYSARHAEKPSPLTGPRVTTDAAHFNRVLALLSSWLLIGIFMDGWAHNHFGEEIESFFTPWHGVLYSGFFACAAYTIGVSVRNHRHGTAWPETLPAGHRLTLLGVALFCVAGVCDLTWHLILGIETSVSAGFSPPHIGIMLSTGLIVSGPLRASWKSLSERPRWREFWPTFVSILLCFSLMSFVTQYAHPLVVIASATQPSGYNDQAIGAVSVMLQAAIMISWILLAVSRWTLPRGSLTLLLTINAIGITSMRDHFQFIIAALLAGIGADILLEKLNPSPSRPGAFRLFAFLVPLIYYALYFAEVLITDRISWPIPLWTGSAVMAGVIGFLLSYLVAPPTFQLHQDD